MRWNPPTVVARALLLSSVASCGTQPTPCLGATGCPRGTECLAARCVLEGSAPVDAGTERLLLDPLELALAARDVGDGLGPSVTLGNPSASPAALYVRFPNSFAEKPVEAAFLLLDQSSGVSGGADLELEIWRASGHWRGPAVAWSEQPGFSPPFTRAIARSIPALPIRADVTALVRYVVDHPARDHGFVIRAVREAGPGVTLNTGLGGGAPPRLDVYFERKPAAAK
jgi:hypothetical protein